MIVIMVNIIDDSNVRGIICIADDKCANKSFLGKHAMTKLANSNTGETAQQARLMIAHLAFLMIKVNISLNHALGSKHLTESSASSGKILIVSSLTLLIVVLNLDDNV